MLETLQKPDVHSIQQMKRERKELFEKAKKFAETREDTAEDQRTIDGMLDDIEKMSKKITEDERMLAVHDTMVDHEDHRAELNPETPEQKYSTAFRDWLANGPSEMQPDNRKILAAKATDLRALGVTTGSVGGYTVPEDFYNQLVDTLKAYGGMRAAGSTIITTSGGNDLPVPIGDDTSNTGAIIGEGSQVASTDDPSFDQMVLHGYLYSSKIIRVGVALLQDEAVNLEQWLAEWLGTRIARITNTHFTTGDDSAKPDGVLNSAADSELTSDKEGSVVYTDIVRLMHSVDPAYRSGARFMFNDSTLSLFKQMQVGSTDARPLWLPGVAVREPDTILGAPYVVNQDFPDHDTGEKAVAYGNFRYYFIRDVRGATAVRFAEKYMDYLQVGFMLFSRHDGGLTLPEAVKYYTVGAD